MKICGIICETNPFHNGHKYLLDTARKLSGCDKILCIMSGNFTQRGEICIFDKYTRAKHLISGGADCVIQLPAPFAVSPAEVFAFGAVKILSSIPEVETIAFGCENADGDFLSSGKILIEENEQFRNILNSSLATGESFIKSYYKAFKALGLDEALVNNPNNILGLEYTKAILRLNSDVKILPVKRIGCGYSDEGLAENYSSARAIRQNTESEKIKNNVPEFVYNDLKNTADLSEYSAMLRHCLFKADCGTLKRIYGCGEGLENKLKSLENLSTAEIIEKATSKRYSSSRIRRIMCANMLELFADETDKFKESDLYIKALAVKKSGEKILSSLSASKFPLISGINCENLSPIARQCFEKDLYEQKVFNHIAHSSVKDYMITV